MINKSHALLFFTFTQQLWSRPAFRSEFTASRETETGKTKTWYFHNLVQFIVIHWVKFWLCQCHYLISCSLPNTRSCQPAKGSCCKNNLLPTLLGRILFVHLCFYHFSSNFWGFLFCPFLFAFPIHKIFQHFLMAPLFLSTLCTSPTGCCNWDSSALSRWVGRSRTGSRHTGCTLQQDKGRCREPRLVRWDQTWPLSSRGVGSGHRWGRQDCRWARWVRPAAWRPAVEPCGPARCVNSKQGEGSPRPSRNHSCSNSPHQIDHGEPWVFPEVRCGRWLHWTAHSREWAQPWAPSP